MPDFAPRHAGPALRAGEERAAAAAQPPSSACQERASAAAGRAGSPATDGRLVLAVVRSISEDWEHVTSATPEYWEHFNILLPVLPFFPLLFLKDISGKDETLNLLSEALDFWLLTCR